MATVLNALDKDGGIKEEYRTVYKEIARFMVDTGLLPG